MRSLLRRRFGAFHLRVGCGSFSRNQPSKLRLKLRLANQSEVEGPLQPHNGRSRLRQRVRGLFAWLRVWRVELRDSRRHE